MSLTLTSLTSEFRPVVQARCNNCVFILYICENIEDFDQLKEKYILLSKTDMNLVEHILNLG